MKKFPIIKDQSVIEKVIKEGFSHLSDRNPFASNGENVLIVRRLGVNEVACHWLFYDKAMNGEFITPTDEMGEFAISPMARSFLSVISHDGFLQINVKLMSFNHLRAIEHCKEILEIF